METKKKKLVVTEDSIVGMGDLNPTQKLVVQLPKQEFRVLKSFTVDKVYHVGDVVLLSDEEVIKELKINKYIK
jgi:hypothetical protein